MQNAKHNLIPVTIYDLLPAVIDCSSGSCWGVFWSPRSISIIGAISAFKAQITEANKQNLP